MSATTTQLESIKALADAVLARNRQRNLRATDELRTPQLHVVKSTPKVAPVARPWETAKLGERAPMRCGGCRNFAPDTVNPKAGLGACSAPGEQSKGLHFPFTMKLCHVFEGRSVET